MKAAVLKGFGDINQLEIRDLPEPEPGPGEVKIKVAAASINPIDLKIRQGYRSMHLPEILGRDVAGEIVALGSDVDTFQLGDKVLGVVNRGYAEYVVAPARDLARLPPSLSLEDAAALPLVATTGAQLIEENTKPARGDTVLVTGAVGGVGRAAVHAAKRSGAKVLAGVRRYQKEEAQELGADGVYAIDDDADIARLPMLDEIADTVSGETIGKLLSHLKPGGRVGSVLGVPEAAKERGIEVHAFMAHPDGALLTRLAEDVARGDFRIPIAERRSLTDIREATRHAEQGPGGKVLLTM